MSSDISKSLPQPAENAAGEIEEELLEAMELARARNLVERSPTSLVRYLEKAGMLSETALYGILCAVQIGPGLARAGGGVAVVCQARRRRTWHVWARDSEAPQLRPCRGRVSFGSLSGLGALGFR